MTNRKRDKLFEEWHLNDAVRDDCDLVYKEAWDAGCTATAAVFADRIVSISKKHQEMLDLMRWVYWEIENRNVAEIKKKIGDRLDLVLSIEVKE